MRDYSRHNNRKVKEIRKDASANRVAIIKTAHKEFADKGAQVSLTDICKAAGVSRPTLYRNFPDKITLIIAVINYNLDLLEEYATKHRGTPDLFFLLLKLVASQQVKFQVLALMIPSEEINVAERLLNIFAKPLADAKEKGIIRFDFSLEDDLLLLIMMIGGALGHSDGRNSEGRVIRALTLVLDGITTST